MSDKDYVVVTAISQHRMRYVMRKDALRKCNTLEDPTDQQLTQWAQDTVVMQECEEFSQEWLGEVITDTYECTEDEMLTLFDKDNDYLSKWDRDQKIKWVSNTFKQEGQDNE